MRTRKLYFENAQGHKLAASLDTPLNSHPRAYALFAHCFSCSRNLTAIGQISRALSGHGIAVLRFDFTGLGESEGSFSDTNFSSNIQDLIEAARFLEREYLPPRILIGHSLGGAAALMAAGKIPSCKAIATIAAPSDPAHVAHLFAEDRETIERDGAANVLLADRPFRIKKQLLEDLRGVRMLDAIRNLDQALLIFHSPEDKVVPILHAARIYTAARHPKSFVSLDRADHLLSDENDSRYVGTVIAAWAEKYLDIPEPKKPKKARDDKLVTVRIGKDRYFTEAEARDHQLIADEPLSSGGSDQGPTPYELLSASLGTCTAITLRMYADRKGWDVSEINVFLRHRKIHAEDCEGCPESKTMMDHIERQIELIGFLNDDQRRRMLEIADRCPVHRTLLQEVKITTRLKD